MGTKIEWSDETWNPLVGCEHVSPGCDGCYAAREASGRLSGHPVYKGLAIGGKFTGEVRTLPDRLEQPLRWKRPRRVFVNSMSDLFHRDVPPEFIADVFAVMAAASWHTFQVLTKRPQRMAALLGDPQFRLLVNSRLLTLGHPVMPGGMTAPDFTWPPNLWLGTSIESDSYTFRADHLRKVGAAVRFLSLEPLLGALPSLDLTGIGWVIVGGESGPHARPMHPAWVQDLRDRCTSYQCPRCRASFSLPAEVTCADHRPERGPAFHFKQWGEWGPSHRIPAVKPGATAFVDLDGATHDAYRRSGPVPSGWAGMNRAGKKATGRELDGRTWDEYPA